MSDALGLSGKVALVTGASRGIGAAIARAFAAAGAAVVINYRSDAAAAEAVVAECRALGGEALAIRADVMDEAAVAALIAETSAEFGRLDALVCNAFAPYRFDAERRTRFPDLAWDDYRSQIDGSVKAAFALCRAALPLLQREASGSIVTIASDLVARPSVPYHDYVTAKAALIGFTRSLAAEIGPLGLRANCVAPGLVWPTGASQPTKEAQKQALIAQTPLGRIARPEDVAGPVLFLASDLARFMTGQTLVVDGGLVMG